MGPVGRLVGLACWGGEGEGRIGGCMKGYPSKGFSDIRMWVTTDQPFFFFTKSNLPKHIDQPNLS